ncbi:hypothetical protein J2Y41_000918 [Arthrobacter sp. 1088]|uniref:hypothetical protein n=1 Tax=Arthrobacter sp. 1088 TaxID=2817768 RepID=UPI00285D04FE|nr:hypothetical protein [Arthrobacter sp. 1088]MDR6685365.1 hypothetical protein [Arthrobacter sp. 1088]
MFVPNSSDHFREEDLPAQIRAIRMPRWAGAALGAALVVIAVAAVAGSILVNDSDSTIIPFWVEALIMAGSIISAISGAFLLWHAGEWVTLTRFEAIVTRAFIVQIKVDRTHLEDFHAYLHQYAAGGGVRSRMVPTFTTKDPYDRLRDLPLPFLAYWNPVGGTEASLPPRAAYIEAWARAGYSPYSRAIPTGAVPYTLSIHRQAVRTGLQRRARLWAILLPVVSIGLGLSLGVGLGPATKALSHTRSSADPQTNRTGIRDLDDALTPGVSGYQWHAKVYPTTGTRDFTFFPTLRHLPPAPYTVRYFIRDPAQHGTDLSVPEQKYGRIVSQGTISVRDPTIEFTLDHDDSTFTFEVYVTDNRGHTTRDSDLYRNLAALPASTPAPMPTR